MTRTTDIHISGIRLQEALPAVFANQTARPSDIWRGDVEIKRGKRYIIEAASGTGKSSLCSYLYGSRQDYQGVISFDGMDIRSLTINEWLAIRRTALAYLPQELDLFPELSAWQNIELKRHLTGFTPTRKVEEWMKHLGIDDRRDFPVGKMSIGQQQRVGIVRALCQPFDFILLDEPVSHLDYENNKLAAEIILEEADRQNAAVIATSVGNQLVMPDSIVLKL